MYPCHYVRIDPQAFPFLGVRLGAALVSPGLWHKRNSQPLRQMQLSAHSALWLSTIDADPESRV